MWASESTLIARENRVDGQPDRVKRATQQLVER